MNNPTGQYRNNTKILIVIYKIMNNKVDYLFPNEEYKPKTADLEKVKHYVNVR